jgi:hypothetical protein
MATTKQPRTAKRASHGGARRVSVSELIELLRKQANIEPSDELSSKDFGKVLVAKNVVARALLTLAHKHRDPTALIESWGHISLWLEDNG